jgi:hypothetical protein
MFGITKAAGAIKAVDLGTKCNMTHPSSTSGLGTLKLSLIIRYEYK